MGNSSDPSRTDHIHSLATSQASDRHKTSPNPAVSDTRTPTFHVNTQHSGPAAIALDSNPKPLGDVQHYKQEGASGVESRASSVLEPSHTKEHGDQDTAVAGKGGKQKWSRRMKKGSIRFVRHTKNALTHSWINVLLVFVPVGIAMNWVPMPASQKSTVVFALNAVAIIPLAGLLSHATESVASRMGDTWASLLNVTFGNAVELIIFIIALAKDQITIVQASILGSILANLLLILGMAFLFGGLRYQEQIYNSTVTQMSACLLSLAVTSLLLPTAFHASFEDTALANSQTIKISRGTSVVLLLVYALYLTFQLKSHAYMYESTPQQVIDEESHPGVLADMLNSSSSSDDSTASDSDSDTSSGSYTTAKKRFKRAIRNRIRRKSNASSFQTGSVPSIISSPSVSKHRALGDGAVSPPKGYFELDELQRQESSYGGRPTLEVDGNEALDGENDQNAPRVRDFGTEHAESANSPLHYPDSKLSRKQKKRNKKDLKKYRYRAEYTEAEPPTADIVPPFDGNDAQPRVGFVEPEENLTTATTGRRPFAKRQLSRVKAPPMPSVFSNTVFSLPPAPHPVIFQAGPMSAARAATTGIRRANSLPLPVRLDLVNHTERTHRLPYVKPNSRSSHTMAINEADAIRKDKEDEDEPPMSRTAAVMLLLISTSLVAFCAELLVDAIPGMLEQTSVSQALIGLIILPIVGNAAEHVTAVTVAMKNKMDLAIGVAVGSSIQIALFVTPFVVLLGWIMDKDMSLYFNIFETVSLFVTAFVVNFLVLDGRSNYLEGSLLIAGYVIIAVCAFFYPAAADESDVGGGTSALAARMLLNI